MSSEPDRSEGTPSLETWKKLRVIDELESAQADRAVEDPLCMTPHLAVAGEEGGNVAEDAAIRVLLL